MGWVCSTCTALFVTVLWSSGAVLSDQRSQAQVKFFASFTPLISGEAGIWTEQGPSDFIQFPCFLQLNELGDWFLLMHQMSDSEAENVQVEALNSVHGLGSIFLKDQNIIISFLSPVTRSLDLLPFVEVITSKWSSLVWKILIFSNADNYRETRYAYNCMVERLAHYSWHILVH